MNFRKKSFILSIIVPVLILSIILGGCSSKEGEEKPDNDNIVTGTGEKPAEPATDIVTPEPSVEPDKTPTPVPTEVPDLVSTEIPNADAIFLKQNYDTYGRSDVYLFSINDIDGDFDLMAARFAGDYALFWVTRMGDDFSFGEQASEFLILTKPAVSTDQYMIPVDTYFGYIDVFEDGTVLASEWETSKIHVYDNKLNPVKDFFPGGEGDFKNIGFSEDGTVWTVDEEAARIFATDISGERLYEFSYDSDLRIIQYLNETDGRVCFETVTNDENYTHGYMFLSVPSGEITYCSETDPELGEEINKHDTLLGGTKLVDLDYTWLIHEPGNACNMVVFPKCEMNEEYSFIDGNKLCSQIITYDEYYAMSQEFRLYDIENGTVSDTLKASDFPERISIYPNGIVGDNIVVFFAYRMGENCILLWDTNGKTDKINDFCDFSKQDPEKYLSEQLENLKESHGIVITPDKYDVNNSSDHLGKILLDIEFVNTFKVGTVSDTEVLVSKSGDHIHPENMRNNDGTKHTFNPHVFTSYYINVHGEKAMETFFNYVDAVRAGEERFECPDPDAVGWVSGRFATYFYPVMNNLSYTEYLGNGWARIYYYIPKEDLAEKINDFEKRICDIIDDVIEDDYTDFEKALALYEFMTEYCTYDYDALEVEDVSFFSEESGYRVLMEKKGICWEISCLYKYLLLQCGVEIEESSGEPDDPNGESHQWNHIVLDGKGYLIDATWGLTGDRKPDLKYFLFTDELRDERDGFNYDTFDIADYQLNDMPELYPYDADDERYKELWDGKYLAFDQNEKCIFYWNEDNEICRFDYS